MAGDGHGGMHNNQDQQNAGNGPKDYRFLMTILVMILKTTPLLILPAEDWGEPGPVDPNWAAGN